MSKSIAISKIRCSNPNKKGTGIVNRNNLQYIATREGVDLDPALELEKGAAPEVYMRYIHERPRSHGLFGNLPDSEIDNLDKLCHEIYVLSNQKPIYKGILSLTEEDAINLGYEKKKKWESTLRAALPDVAHELNIPVSHLKWVAAFHQEKGHPHVHYMLWSTDNKVSSPFIHTSVQHRCREIFSKYIFTEERTAQVIAKTSARDDLIVFGKDAILSELKDLRAPEPPSAIIGRINYDELSELQKQMLQLFRVLPPSGRLNYKFLAPTAKEEVDYIVDAFISRPPLKQQYAAYTHSVEELTRSYSVTGKKAEQNIKRADYDIRTRLANVLLKEMKNLYLISSETDNILTKDSSVFHSSHSKESDLFDLNFERSTKHNDWAILMKSANTYHDQKDYNSLNNIVMQIESQLPQLEQSDSQYDRQAVINAYYNLGGIYTNPESPLKNIQKGLFYYNSAPSNSFAQYQLGKLYYRGEVVTQDISLSLKYLQESAAQDNEQAIYMLGNIYADQGTSIYNPKLALANYHRAINEFDNSFAKYQLGRIYLFGIGVEKDVTLGKIFLKDAANDGNAYATTLLDYYSNSQMIFAPYMITQKFFSTLLQQTVENQNSAKEFERSSKTLSKKAKKELAKKNQIKGSLPDF